MVTSRGHRWIVPSSLGLALLACGCHAAPSSGDAGSRAAEPVEPSWDAAPGYDPQWRAPAPSATARAAAPSARPVAAPPNSPEGGAELHPLARPWTLVEAAAGLAPGDRWVATVKTSVGDLECELWPERAPATVANFVGLANGTRPWKSRRGVVREPAFDTAVFDRVLPGLLLGVARTGEVGKDAPGYTLPDEAWPAMKHDRAGLLCAGRNPAFDWLITAGPAPLLDRAPDAGPRPRFTVFGSCGPIKLIEAIANAPSKRGKPVTAIHVEQVRVTRR